MKSSLIATLLVLLVLLIDTSPLAGTIEHAHKSFEQDTEKSLDIERYANEPLELVELKVRDEPVKNKITAKYRFNDGGLDNVTFKGKDGWFKGLVIKLRNVSGRTIYGVSALLYFQPSSTRTRFSLPLTASTAAKQGVLEPMGEITLAVSDQAWVLTSNILGQHGVDVELATVKFSVDTVRFGEDLIWRKGYLHRRDPNNPDEFNIINEKATH